MPAETDIERIIREYGYLIKNVRPRVLASKINAKVQELMDQTAKDAVEAYRQSNGESLMEALKAFKEAMPGNDK